MFPKSFNKKHNEINTIILKVVRKNVAGEHLKQAVEKKVKLQKTKKNDKA